jgi:hypothetical protein
MHARVVENQRAIVEDEAGAERIGIGEEGQQGQSGDNKSRP